MEPPYTQMNTLNRDGNDLMVRQPFLFSFVVLSYMMAKYFTSRGTMIFLLAIVPTCSVTELFMALKVTIGTIYRMTAKCKLTSDQDL
jgi:hypothetical protein